MICWDCLDGVHRPNCGCACTVCAKGLLPRTSSSRDGKRRSSRGDSAPLDSRRTAGGVRRGAGAPAGSKLPGPLQEVIRVELRAGVSVSATAVWAGCSRDQVRTVRRDMADA